MRPLEMDRKEELEKWFDSDISIRKLAIKMGVVTSSINKAWVRMYGKEKVTERGTRLRKLNGRMDLNSKKIIIDCEQKRRIIEAFYNNETIEKIANIEKIDQRTIRHIWRKEFGLEAVKERGFNISHNLTKDKNKISQEIKNKIIAKLYQNPNIKQISKEFGVSRSFIRNIITEFSDLNELILKETSQIRRLQMKKQRSSEAITEEQKQKAIEFFGTDLTTREIGKIIGLCSSSVTNIFKENVSSDKYKERVRRMTIIAKKKAMNSLIKAGKLGSKPENEFYQLLHNSLTTEVIHHDLDLLPPFEIDITLPELKIAIMWDGIGHIKPVFGENIFKQVKYRDKWKRKTLAEKGWIVFEVIDLNNKTCTPFIEKQAQRLYQLLEEIGHADIIKRDI